MSKVLVKTLANCSIGPVKAFARLADTAALTHRKQSADTRSLNKGQLNVFFKKKKIIILKKKENQFTTLKT